MSEEEFQLCNTIKWCRTTEIPVLFDSVKFKYTVIRNQSLKIEPLLKFPDRAIEKLKTRNVFLLFVFFSVTLFS